MEEILHLVGPSKQKPKYARPVDFRTQDGARFHPSILCVLQSKLLKRGGGGGHIRDHIGNFYRGY